MNRENWERLKTRLDPEDPRRYPKEWDDDHIEHFRDARKLYGNCAVRHCLKEAGGYIPMIDHMIPTDISLENFKHYQLTIAYRRKCGVWYDCSDC